MTTQRGEGEFGGFEAGAWLFVRLVLGVTWVQGSLDKVGQAGWTQPPLGRSVAGFLQGAIAKSTAGPHPEVPHWYHTLVEQLFLPNAALFGQLVAFSELLVGVALVLGLLTRVAALAGLTMNLAFLWAGTTSTNPPMLLLGLAVLCFGERAGRIGLDRWLLPWFARHTTPATRRQLRAVVFVLGFLVVAALAMAVTDPNIELWAGLAALSAIVTIAVTWRHRAG